MQGVSGNWWKPDIVIVDSLARDSEALNYGVKLIGEIKMQDFEGNRPTIQTYKEHMWRAYARLGDMRNCKFLNICFFRISTNKGVDLTSMLTLEA